MDQTALRRNAAVQWPALWLDPRVDRYRGYRLPIPPTFFDIPPTSE